MYSLTALNPKATHYILPKFNYLIPPKFNIAAVNDTGTAKPATLK